LPGCLVAGWLLAGWQHQYYTLGGYFFFHRTPTGEPTTERHERGRRAEK